MWDPRSNVSYPFSPRGSNHQKAQLGHITDLCAYFQLPRTISSCQNGQDGQTNNGSKDQCRKASIILLMVCRNYITACNRKKHSYARNYLEIANIRKNNGTFRVGSMSKVSKQSFATWSAYNSCWWKRTNIPNLRWIAPGKHLLIKCGTERTMNKKGIISKVGCSWLQ